MVLRRIDDALFEESDNLFVFMLQHGESHQAVKPIVQEFRSTYPQLSYVRFYYTDAVPERDGAPAADVKYAVYKGFRRETASEVNLARAAQFFEPVSEEPSAAHQKNEEAEKSCNRKVCGGQFEEEVLDRATPTHPVLVQIFEESCFLCFLMRPYLMSVSDCLADVGAPITLRKLDIERNDFPLRTPVARGTPTFIEYKGGKGTKWAEFRPAEFSEKLLSSLPPESAEASRTEIERLTVLFRGRFTHIMQLAMWNAEVMGIMELCTATAADYVRRGGKSDDSVLHSVVGSIMQEDLQRFDRLDANLRYLQREITEAEKDALVCGLRLAEDVLAHDQAHT